MQILTSAFRRPGARTALGIAVAGLAIGTSIIGGAPANADPRQFSALTGVGSDTTQDITNALAGNSNNISYLPITSSAASAYQQITSWDATGTACIATKTGGANINRPNGSTGGRKALSRAIDGGTWGTSTCGGATGKPVAGLIEFARSSDGPTAGDTGTALTYVPMGLDATSFAYYRNGGGAVTSLTRAELISIYTNGSLTVGGVRIVPCGIQTESGTKKFWQKGPLNSMTNGTEDIGTAECNLATATSYGGRIEENRPNELKAKGDSAAMTNSALCPIASPCQVIVGMSAGSFIAQTNGVSPNTTAVGVDLGRVSNNGSGVDLGFPYTGTGSALAPSALFYADANFGRSVYVVLDTLKATGVGNVNYKSLFVGSTSALCSSAAQSRVNSFGFLTPGNCGSTTLKGSLFTGNI
ncbi:MAG: hypothetical protein HYR89_00880 [Actinobacteria bacterium]|nr:hypothetical protein [Actinomycetota bacterium]